MKKLLVLLLALAMVLSALVSCDLLEGNLRSDEDEEEEEERTTKRPSKETATPVTEGLSEALTEILRDTAEETKTFDDAVAETIFFETLAPETMAPETIAPETMPPETMPPETEPATEAITENLWGDPGFSNVRFDGFELVFLTRDEGEWSTREIFAEGYQAHQDTLSEAVYTRNSHIYDEHGVIVKEYRVSTGEIYTKVRNEAYAPTGDFHAVISNVTDALNFTNNTLICNLSSEEASAINFTNSWWDQDFVESMTIADRVFFANGDLLTCDDDATFALMFNKDLATERKLPDLYKVVTSYQWTHAKFYEYQQQAFCDLNSDGVLSYDQDILSYVDSLDGQYSLFIGAGLRLVSKNPENGELEWSFNVERATDVTDSARAILGHKSFVSINDLATANELSLTEVGERYFGGNHAVFFGDVLHSVRRMRGFDIDFGILPYPMYDQQQGGYKSFMHSAGSVLSLPQSAKRNMETVSTMIEIMACYSQNTVTKAYYDELLTTKNGRDEASEPMIDLILNTREYDPAYYFGWGSAYPSLIGAFDPSSNTHMSSASKKLSMSVSRHMDRTIEKIDRIYSELEYGY